MTFRYDTRHLPKQVQAIIRERDMTNDMLRDKSECRPSSRYYHTSIFMRLGKNPLNKFSGFKTIETYINFCNKYDSAWFSTDSLSGGMADKRQQEFSGVINAGYIVGIFFAIGKNGGGTNEVEYMAEVLEFESSHNKIMSPDKSLTPDEWKNDMRYIWIKIRNIQVSEYKSKDFIVISSGKVLTESIKASEFHFGYVKKR